jgi:hypothetical protein
LDDQPTWYGRLRHAAISIPRDVDLFFLAGGGYQQTDAYMAEIVLVWRLRRLHPGNKAIAYRESYEIHEPTID